MPAFVNGTSSNGSLRVHTRASQPRTSSNQTFQEKFRSGLGSGINLTNSALRQVAKPMPGSAALSATLSDAARNLTGASKLDGSGSAMTNASVDGDMGTLQDEMLRNNQDMLEQQMRVAQITTAYSVKTNTLKAHTDTAKTIISNIR